MSLGMEPVTFSESGGVRYLHFGSELIQGAMRIRDPDEIYLEYNQQMMAWLLFLETRPGMRVAQLGLGTGALTKFQHHYCPAVKTTVVELNGRPPPKALAIVYMSAVTPKLSSARNFPVLI